MQRSGAKWYEEGEKSNAYFLNLITRRKEQTTITKLDRNGESLTCQKDITEHVVDFYSELYSEKETDDNYNELLSDLPTLNEADRSVLDAPISLDELERTLKGCKESAPGPDGISYLVYKKLWPEVGKFLLEAWNQSIADGILPEDQRISCITLLPKTGKDLNKIENWRPITLTNCDLKIFTKLLANRVSTILDKLISPSQTAYVPGRVVHDNLRVFDFYKNYCKSHNVDALLVSLDAKKAFDSVSHKYMHKVLTGYGFSESFIDLVKLLYNDIKASILVNGFKSVMIKIGRSVKQGDALSCALFILCIDPLIRKIEKNQNIKSIPIPRSIYSNIKIDGKVGGFADDIGLAVKNEPSTLKAIFDDYKLFSKLSGIELNIEKTEILKLNLNTNEQPFEPCNFTIDGKIIKSSESIKICGITFSNNTAVEYQNNILQKISKLEKQIVRWLPRALSVEGKLVIVKTFGLSQLIYSLQMCEIKKEDVKRIEGIIFRFLWNKRWVGNPAPDRIKRNLLKLPYDKGGLKAPDIEVLERALKTKQFIRAMNSSHQINFVQKYVLEKDGYFEYYKIEYAKICTLDCVTATYQITTNFLTDSIRAGEGLEGINEEEGSQTRVNIIASTDVIEFFRRNNIPLVIHRFRTLANQGIENVHELINESRFPRDDRLAQCAREILSFFPASWIELVKASREIDSEINYENSYPTRKCQFTNSNAVTVKGLREILLVKDTQGPLPYENFGKFGLVTDTVEHNPFSLARQALIAPRDKFYKLRILHGDIFCNQRMHRFKMITSPNCSTCPEVIETVKHVLWECPRSMAAWDFLNSYTRQYLGREYVSYEAIILGNKDPNMAMETMIVWTMKMILSINREQRISNQLLESKLKTLFYYEKHMFGVKSKRMRSRWGGLLNMFGAA